MKRALFILLALCLVCSMAQAKKYWDPPAGQGVSTVGTGGDYASLALAAADFVTSAPTGNWTVEILNDLTEPTNSWWGQDTGSYIVTIKPAAGVIANVIFSKTTDNNAGSGGMIIGLPTDAWSPKKKTDNFTIDGSNNGTNSRDLTLTIPATTTFAYNCPIHIAGDSDNIVIKNCNIINLSPGTGSSICAIRITSRWDTTCYAPDNLLVQNNYIQVLAAQQGHGLNITYGGTRGAAGPNAALKNFAIDGNTIKSRLRGIFINDGYNYTISNNIVENGKAANINGFNHYAVYYNSTNGPGVGNAAFHRIYNNYIYQETANTYAGTYGATVLGLTSIGSDANVVADVYNNYIEVKSTVAVANANAHILRGIYCTSGITYNIINNTINVVPNANLTALTAAGGCYGIGAASVSSPVKLKNNIIMCNQGSSSATGGPAAFVRTYSHASDVFDNNIYLAKTANNGNVGYYGPSAIATATRYRTLAEWQTGTGKDAASKLLDPSADFEADGYHLKATVDKATYQFGADVSAIALLAKDIDGQNRDVLVPYVGADEPFAAGGVTLTVASAQGSPVPAVGVLNTNTGTTVTASVVTPVSGGTGIRYVCTGYTGTGVIGSGAGNSVSFIMGASSESITWNWKTQYQLTTAIAPAGAAASGIITPAAGWYDAATVNSMQFTPANAGWIFNGWTGDITSSNNPENVTMDAAKTVTANILWALYQPQGSTAINFGAKPIVAFGGVAESQGLIIKNGGTSVLTLSAFNRTGSADFEITNATPVNIAVGTTATLEIKYTPNTQGNVNASFEVVTNDPVGGNGTITCQAIGIGSEYQLVSSADAYTTPCDSLTECPSDVDLIEGIDAVVEAGAFHSAYSGGVAPITNGLFDADGVTALANDYGQANPSLVLRYDNLYNATINKVIIFSGHNDPISGARAFINCKVEILQGGVWSQLGGNLTTGNFGTPAPMQRTVAFTKMEASLLAAGVDGIKFSFYGVANSFATPYEFEAPGADAIEGTIIKEIDVFGENKTSVSDWRLIK